MGGPRLKQGRGPNSWGVWLCALQQWGCLQSFVLGRKAAKAWPSTLLIVAHSSIRTSWRVLMDLGVLPFHTTWVLESIMEGCNGSFQYGRGKTL